MIWTVVYLCMSGTFENFIQGLRSKNFSINPTESFVWCVINFRKHVPVNEKTLCSSISNTGKYTRHRNQFKFETTHKMLLIHRFDEHLNFVKRLFKKNQEVSFKLMKLASISDSFV